MQSLDLVEPATKVRRSRNQRLCIFCRLQRQKCEHPTGGVSNSKCALCDKNGLPCGPSETASDSVKFVARAQVHLRSFASSQLPGTAVPAYDWGLHGPSNDLEINNPEMSNKSHRRFDVTSSLPESPPASFGKSLPQGQEMFNSNHGQCSSPPSQGMDPAIPGPLLDDTEPGIDFGLGINRSLFEEEYRDHNPGHAAAADGDIERLQLLLNEGWNSNSRDDEGQTAAYIAASFGRENALEFLSKNGADLSARTFETTTMLEAAAKGNHDGTIRKLKTLKYDFAEKAMSGESAITIAAEHGYVEACLALLDCGVDRGFRRRSDGKTVSEIARSKNLPALMFVLGRWTQQDAHP